MKLRFAIQYRTEWGQQIVVCLNYGAEDGTARKMQLALTTQDGDQWYGETAIVESRRSPVRTFTYYYIVADSDGKEIRREWTLVERRYAFDASKTFIFEDQWRDRPLNAHLYTAAYSTTSQQPWEQTGEPKLPLFRKTLLFRVSAPQLTNGQKVAIVGSHPALGSWNPARYLTMEYVGQKDWMLTLNVDWMGMPIEYKYVVIEEQTHQLVAWEEGENRTADTELEEGDVRVLCGQPLRLAEKSWRAAGVCVPLFALRSDHSWGVGDFGDLKRFVDWAAATGLRVIQLLPLNDTTNKHDWSDSYPYNIISAFDLHPHYMDLDELGELKDKAQMTAFRRRKNELNALAYSDYVAVDRVKGDYLHLLYEQQQQEGETRNEHDWIQFHLRRQLKGAADYARSKGIFLKGDLPIGMSRESQEANQHPEFFNLDSQTGAPPDAFARQGQNWGFPTYQWEGEGRALFIDWFRRRLKEMEQYFDAIRIDHVLGFFRIWEIPSEQLFGTMGHFSPALPMTAGEIAYFGLNFKRDFLTRPFINDRTVDRLFGIHADYVRTNFLTRRGYGLYDLKEEVDTQRKVQQCFEGKGDENSLWIRDGLYRLVANVLFLEDPRQPEMYHPRINAFQEPVYEALDSEQQGAFLRIYNHFFFQRHSALWGNTGYNRLTEVLQDSRMLICGEDLGMLPDCVKPVLDSLQILSLEIQQMPKETGIEFTHLDGNPVRSVATIATHDMAPLRLWWEENTERTQRFFSTMLQKQGRAPEHLPAHLAEEIIARHLYSPSMLCILSLQDWLAMDSELWNKNPRDERINVPSDPYNRWQWRMHLSIDDLLKADKLNNKIRTMVGRSKR